MSKTHNVDGRPYAKLSELREGDMVELDDSFTCHPGTPTTIVNREGSLCFVCNHGWHHLSGQADDGEHCVGVYKL